METGLFVMPSHPPEKSLHDGIQWDLQMIRWAEDYDFAEAWIGEHFFDPWQPCPAPDLMIAQALMQTSRIRLGAGCHLLPCHHPLSLAYRISYLDHMAKGRLNFGMGAGTGPGEMKGFDMAEFPGQNREKMEEALEVIRKAWDPDHQLDHDGKYWKVRPGPPGPMNNPHLYPYQKPHPPMAIAGFSAQSPSLQLAGEHGYWPMSFDVSETAMIANWASVEEGAKKSGRTPNRKDWRIVRSILVADTDEEARNAAANGYFGRYWTEFAGATMKRFGLMDHYKNRPGMTDDEVDPAFMAEHIWLCGSPETVAKGIERLHEKTGGFGSILMLGMDYEEQPELWRRSMELMGKDVIPRLRHLN